MNNKENDLLKTLFAGMPEEELPASFRENVMDKIIKEALKAKKREERIGLVFVIAASIIIVAISILAIIYMDMPKLEWSIPSLTSMPFYLYIGALAMLLLLADYKIRQSYKKKHNEDI